MLHENMFSRGRVLPATRDASSQSSCCCDPDQIHRGHRPDGQGMVPGRWFGHKVKSQFITKLNHNTDEALTIFYVNSSMPYRTCHAMSDVGCPWPVSMLLPCCPVHVQPAPAVTGAVLRGQNRADMRSYSFSEVGGVSVCPSNIGEYIYVQIVS